MGNKRIVKKSSSASPAVMLMLMNYLFKIFILV